MVRREVYAVGGVRFPTVQATPGVTGAGTQLPVVDTAPPVVDSLSHGTTTPTLEDATTAILNIQFTDAANQVDAQNAPNLEATIPGITGTATLIPVAPRPSNAQTVNIPYTLSLPTGQTWANASSFTPTATINAAAAGGPADDQGNAIAGSTTLGTVNITVYPLVAEFTSTAQNTDNLTLEIEHLNNVGYVVDWGDGTNNTGTTQARIPLAKTYTDLAATHDIKYYSESKANPKEIRFTGALLTTAQIDADLPALERVQLTNNDLTSFATSATWPLRIFSVNRNNLNAIDLHDAWGPTLLQVAVNSNNISTLNVSAAFTNLTIWTIGNNPLTVDTTPLPGWTSLRTYSANNAQQTLNTLPSTLTALTTVLIGSNTVAGTFTLPATLTAMQRLEIGNVPALTEVVLDSAHTAMREINLNTTGLTNFVLPPELLALDTIDLSSANLSATTLDAIYTVLSTGAYTATGRAVDTELNTGSGGVSSALITAATTNGWTVTN